MSKKDAGRFRGQAARCRALQRGAKRADVQEASRCLAQEYETAARALEQPGRAGDPTVARLLVTSPMLAMQSCLAALPRASLAFSLPLG